MRFPLAIANSFCSPLPPPPNLCHFNQVSVKYSSKLLYAVRHYWLHVEREKGDGKLIFAIATGDYVQLCLNPRHTRSLSRALTFDKQSRYNITFETSK